MTKFFTETGNYISELRNRVLDWTADNRPSGKHAKADSEQRGDKFRQLRAASEAALSSRWLATPARRACAAGAGAAVVLTGVVYGTAGVAEQTPMVRQSVVSEATDLPAEEQPQDGQGTPEAPAEVPAEAPAEEAPAEAPVEALAEPAPAEAPVMEPVVAEAPAVAVPVDNVRITSTFGWRSNVNPLLPGGSQEFHNGLDFGAPTGTPVKSFTGGTVVYAQWHQYGGLRIIVDHGDGLQTTYNHLNAIHVEVGQTVATGQEIGTVGSTGNSTGPHLHFEVLRHGEYEDPAPLLGL